MFIRKNKLIKEIDRMIEDTNYYIQTFENCTLSDKNERISAFKFGIVQLEEVKYYLVHGKHVNNLRKRK